MSYHEGSNWQARKEDEGKPLYENEGKLKVEQKEPEKKFFIDEISPMIKAVINKEMSISKFVEALNEISNRNINEWMKENPPFGTKNKTV